MKLYDCNGYLDREDLHDMDDLAHNLRVIATGEIRSPRQGEWIIDGDSAHKVYWDSDVPRAIGRLVRVKTTVTIVED